MDKASQLLERNIDSVYPAKDKLLQALKSGKKLRIYFGVDPTNPNIHIGNAIPLWKLGEFQKLGHEVIFLIGDFTGLIGDPAEKETTRPLLTKKDIGNNAKNYISQARKILDFDKNPPKVLYNSAWNSRLKFGDVIKLASEFTVQQMLERDMFQKRLKERNSIAIHEFLYPLVQGYDSVAMNVDIEIGGTDQTFNMLIGRQLVKNHLNKEKFVLTTPLLPGNDGRKMSKSYGNVINITDEPKDMFGRAMAVKDDLVKLYLNLTTQLTENQIKDTLKKGPMESKKTLGYELVKLYHGEKKAHSAQAEFEKTFQKGELPSEIKAFGLDKELKTQSLIEFLVAENIAYSNSDARRLIEQGGITLIDPFTLNETKIEDGLLKLEEFKNQVIRVRRNWIKFV